jgi:hypothetical protein
MIATRSMRWRGMLHSGEITKNILVGISEGNKPLKKIT